MVWKVMGYSSHCFQEMSLECSDGSLVCILPIDVIRDKLVFDAPLLSHGRFVLLSAFIIKYLQINEYFFVLEPLYYGVV